MKNQKAISADFKVRVQLDRELVTAANSAIPKTVTKGTGIQETEDRRRIRKTVSQGAEIQETGDQRAIHETVDNSVIREINAEAEIMRLANKEKTTAPK